MARLKYNGLTTTLGGDLTNSGTTITFGAALTHSGTVLVPTITGTDYIPLTILTSANAVSEIIYLTAYTSGATTGTVTRAQESTSAAYRASGSKVVNSLTAFDFTEVMSYKALWAAGAYVKGSVVTREGSTYVAKVATSATPLPQSSNYSNDFTVAPTLDGTLWAQTGVVAPRTVTVVTGQTTPDPAITTALSLYGGGQNNVTMYVELTLNFTTSGSITFYDTIQSEGGSDPGVFYIDGVEQHRLSGSQSSYTTRTYAVSIGTHVFRWAYFKDGSFSSGFDAYRIAKLRTVGSVIGTSDWDAISSSGSSSGGASGSIDTLTDVDTASTTPTIGQTLLWDGSQWKPGTVSGGSSSSPVQLTVARSGGTQTVSSSSFTTIDFGSAPTVNVGGGAYSSGLWTVPVTGRYMILANVRSGDGIAARSLAIAVHTSNADGSWVLWSSFGGTGSFSRNGVYYQRIDSFTAGDVLRCFIYSDGSNIDISSAKMTIDKIG